MQSEINKSKPARIWVRSVEAQNRIRLGKEVADHVHWLKAEDNFSINCLASIGPNEQLVICPKLEEGYFAKLADSLRTSPATANDIFAPWMDLARYSATTWEIACSFEAKAKRFSIVFPREARDLDIVPNENGSVVIFNTGEILEIWSSHKWIAHINKIGSNLTHHISIGLDALENR
jgi:hypothetical protein